MKDFLYPEAKQTKTISKNLLVSCFMAGYLFFTLLIMIFRPQVHHFIDAIL